MTRLTRTCSPRSTWIHDAAQPVLMARCTPASRTTRSTSIASRVLRGTGARGVGLIVTAGLRPTSKAGQHRSPPPHTAQPRRSTADHRRRARRGRQDRAADPAHRPLRLSPLAVAPFAAEIADLAVHAAGTVGARGVERQNPRFVRCARLAASRLRRRRGDGLRGVLHQPVPRQPHQPAHRRLGGSYATACACRSRSSAARARPSAPTSSSSIACRCSTSCRTAVRGTKVVQLAKAISGRARRSSIPASAARSAHSDDSHVGAPAAFAW